MRFKIILLLGIGLSCFSTQAQTVLPTTGFSSAHISWTVGEVITSTISRSDGIITQGFNQPMELLSTGLIDVSGTDMQISAYPNPVIDQLSLSFDRDETYQWSLFGQEGRLLLKGTSANHGAVIDFSPFLQGKYILHLQSASAEKSIVIIKE